MGATGFAGLFFIIILAFHIVPPASLGLSAPLMPERAKGLYMVLCILLAHKGREEWKQSKAPPPGMEGEAETLIRV